MIIIHSTKKLQAQLPIDDRGYLPLSAKMAYKATIETQKPSLLSGWHANLLMLQRRKCVLIVHDRTRFPLFIPALKKVDFANLDWWFGDALMNTLLKCGATELQLEKTWGQLQRIKIDTVCNRSVQGTMNQMSADIKFHLSYSQIGVAEITGHRLSAWLADRPCRAKGYKNCIWPTPAFLALIDTLP